MKRLDDSFKESLLRALDEDRYDDLVFMLANRLRSRQKVISIHARASLPVGKDLCQPLITNHLSKAEIEAFDFRTTGWYIVAVEDCRVVAAEPFPYTVDDPAYRKGIEDYVISLSGDIDDGPDVYGAFHQDGHLSDFQHLYEFRPECKRA